MKDKPKEPFVPVERSETVRREIIDLLKDNVLSAKDVSGSVGVPVKEVYEHLDHIQKSIGKGGRSLRVIPAECKKCGFVFKKRERLKKPGKCPVCRSESIEEPLFSIREKDTVTDCA